MIQCIAIDDEPLALQIIEDFCSRVPYLDLQNTFTRTSEAEKHLNKASVHLLFLDIQMPDILGIDCNSNLMAQMTKYIESIGLQKREDTIIDTNFILSQVNLERLKNNPVKITNL